MNEELLSAWAEEVGAFPDLTLGELCGGKKKFLATCNKELTNAHGSDTLFTGPKDLNPTESRSTEMQPDWITQMLPPGIMASAEQIALFEEAKNGHGHLVVDSKAGTGKTFTSILMMVAMPEREICYMAFGNKIVEECRPKIKRGQIMTLHSSGFRCTRSANAKVQAKPEKASIWPRIDAARAAWAKATDAEPFYRQYIQSTEASRQIAALVAWAKNTHPLVCKTSDLEDMIPSVRQFQNVDEMFWHTMAQLAAKVMRLTIEEFRSGRPMVIDFDDMIWLPLVCNLARPIWDVILVDECQDMNAAQLMLAQRLCRGRLIFIGDPNQAIFGFRGADSGSMERMTRELDAKVLKLTQTRRCAKAIVQACQEYVPEFQAHESNPQGLVGELSYRELFDAVQPTDFVLSRTNAALVSTCLKFIARGIRSHIVGRDMGDKLMEMIRRFEKKTKLVDPADLMERLQEWLDAEREKIERTCKKNHDLMESRLGEVEDTYATFDVLCEAHETIRDVKDEIDHLFSDEDPGSSVICSTVHKAKGLETNRVFILESTFKMTGPEENNLHYVARSRAKLELYYVAGGR